MTREEIESAIIDIMMFDGPDGHTDGSNIITDFIIELLAKKGEEWILKYRETN